MQSRIPERSLSTASPPRSRLRSPSVLLGVTALLAAALTACTDDADYAQTCVDRETRVRVDDESCEDGSSRTGWYYVPRGERVPAIGSTASGGTFTKPTSGTIMRGGFGTRGGVVGG